MRPLARIAAIASRALGPGSRRGASHAAGALAMAAVLAGCGSAASGTATPATSAGAKLRAQERAIHEQVLASLNHDTTTRYGGIPTYIPRSHTPLNRIVTATSQRPVVAIQGDAVRIESPTGSAIATAVGPDVPDRIQGSATLHTPASFVLTFSDVRGRLPLSRKLITITDEQGATLTPTLHAASGRRVPAIVPTGRPFTLRLSTKVSVGDGRLRYLPVGNGWLAQWDFDVETD